MVKLVDRKGQCIMVSKQLESIMATMPAATAEGQRSSDEVETSISKKRFSGTVRITASATMQIKDELKQVAKDCGITETAVILKALKAFGFKSITDAMLVDKRTLR